MVINKRFILALLWLSTFSLYGHATATATIDRTTISIDETFQLKLTLDETSLFDKPDISVLENNFTVLGSQKSSQTSYINGTKSAVTEWSFEIAPKHQGVLTIPSIDIDGDKTRALSIRVTGSQNDNASSSNIKPVFMEAIANKNSVYVQEQLLLTLRINTSMNLQQLQLANLEISNAFVKEVSNTQYQRTINNTPYITYEIVYAIFPQTSGELSIPSLEASGIKPDARQFNSFFGGGERVRLHSQPLTITVKETPAQVGSNLWLPAKSLILKETWSADPTNIKVGDSITRTITTTATGLSNEQLPPVTMQADSHFKVYPDQPALSDNKTNEGIVGERKDGITLVATEPGEVTLPAITVQWWDITANTMKTETLPEVAIKIVGSAGAVATPQTSQPNNITTPVTPPAPVTSAVTAPAAVTTNTENLLPWQIATGISSTMALLFMVLFFVSKSQSPTQMKEAVPDADASDKALLQALKSACTSNNVADIRSNLLAWARQTWPNASIHSASDLHHVFQGEDIQTWTNKIDANLYTTNHSKENWMDFYHFIAEKQASIKKGKTDKLEPLYPV